MNDRPKDEDRSHPRREREEAEKELASRLERGEDRVPREEDAPLLRDATAWSDRIDELVAGERNEEPGATGGLDSGTVRERVLERIAPERDRERAAPPSGGRSPAPSTPWWRRVAPVAVAAGLAGLFLWREIGSPPGEPDPEPPARRSVEVDAEASKSAPLLQEDAAPAAESPAARLRALTVGPPLDVEAESLLVRIDRLQADSRARGAALDRLAAIRNAVADSTLVARIDSTLSEGPR